MGGSFSFPCAHNVPCFRTLLETPSSILVIKDVLFSPSVLPDSAKNEVEWVLAVSSAVSSKAAALLQQGWFFCGL